MPWLLVLLVIAAHPAVAGTHTAPPLALQRAAVVPAVVAFDLGDLTDGSDEAAPLPWIPTVSWALGPVRDVRLDALSRMPARPTPRRTLFRTAADDEPPQSSA